MSDGRTSGSAFSFLNELGQLGDDLEQVAHNPKVAKLEYRRVAILIDSDDNACTSHPDFVLNRSRDTACDVQLGRDRLARRTGLVRVRNPSGVHRGTRSADRTAERFGQRLDDVEMLWAA